MAVTLKRDYLGRADEIANALEEFGFSVAVVQKGFGVIYGEGEKRSIAALEHIEGVEAVEQQRIMHAAG